MFLALVQPSKFLFLNLRKATLHQSVCVFNSPILPDHILLLLAFWDPIQCFLRV